MTLQAYMVELYQDTLVDLLLPKNAKRLKLEIKKDLKVLLLKVDRLWVAISAVLLIEEFIYLMLFFCYIIFYDYFSLV